MVYKGLYISAIWQYCVATRISKCLMIQVHASACEHSASIFLSPHLAISSTVCVLPQLQKKMLFSSMLTVPQSHLSRSRENIKADLLNVMEVPNQFSFKPISKESPSRQGIDPYFRLIYMMLASLHCTDYSPI